ENTDDVTTRFEEGDDRARNVLVVDGDANLLRSRVDGEVGELAGGIEVLDNLVEGGDHAVVDFDVARRRLRREQDRAFVEALVEHAFGECRTANRRSRGALAGMADAIAHVDRRVEGIRRRDGNALVE